MTQRCLSARFTTLGVALALPGCMALSPQLAPTDFAQLERIERRDQRDAAYAESAIYRHREPQGVRYTKGPGTTSEKRSWQSLDVILRSDRHAAAAMPTRPLLLSRIFLGLAIGSTMVGVAGVAASAREGVEFGHLNGSGAMLLTGGLATVASAIAAGIFYRRARVGYDHAVDVYNDSLGMRLGLYSGEGDYIPARGLLVDDDGYIVLDGSDAPQPDAPITTAPITPAPITPAAGAAESNPGDDAPAPDEPTQQSSGESVADPVVTAPNEAGGLQDGPRPPPGSNGIGLAAPRLYRGGQWHLNLGFVPGRRYAAGTKPSR